MIEDKEAIRRLVKSISAAQAVLAYYIHPESGIDPEDAINNCWASWTIAIWSA